MIDLAARVGDPINTIGGEEGSDPLLLEVWIARQEYHGTGTLSRTRRSMNARRNYEWGM